MPPLAIVTGANSGIGHAFAQLLIEQGYDVHACDHVVGAELQSLTRARLHRLDVRQPESISGLAAQLAGKPVNLLLNVAGVMFPSEQDGVETTNKSVLTTTFETNAFGPLLLTQALLPNLLLAAADGSGEGIGAKVGIVSSRVGSMGDNSSGGSYAYRASKAAVNSVGKNLAVDLRDKGVVVSLLHPGVVRSNLNPAADASNPEAVEPEEAARKLWEVLGRVGVEESGRFWHREGWEVPW